MNELLQKFARQVGFGSDENGEIYTSALEHLPITEDLNAFAELIVRECIGVVEGGSFLHDQAPTAIFARECSGAIKRHFGVQK